MYRGEPTNTEEVDSSLQTLKESEIAALKSLAFLLLKELKFLENFEVSTGKRAQSGKIDLHEELQRFEIGLIRSALIQAGGVQSKAAQLLGLKVSTLNVKIKRYKIDLLDNQSKE